MTEIVKELLTAFFGSVGFALLFNINKKHLLIASLNGVLCWGIYLLCREFSENTFLPSFFATLVVTAVAEVQARAFKCPSTPFYIIGLIPLIPGSSLYYMIAAIARDDHSSFAAYAGTLLWTVLGIAAAFGFLVSAIHLARNLKNQK